MHFMAVNKKRKGSGFVIYSYLKDSAFTAVKRRAKYVKGYHLSTEGIRKEYVFFQNGSLLV